MMMVFFMSHSQIEYKYQVKCNFLQGIQVRQSIPIHWRNTISTCIDKGATDVDKIQILNKFVKMENLTCKMFYWTLISTKYKEPQCKTKWAEYFPLFKKADDSVWTRIFEKPFKIARETNLQSFQYRVIHRIIPCNKWLHSITVKSSSLCDFCKNEDNLIHYFMHCSNTKLAVWL